MQVEALSYKEESKYELLLTKAHEKWTEAKGKKMFCGRMNQNEKVMNQGLHSVGTQKQT